MRKGTILKGYCPDCEGMRAFQLTCYESGLMPIYAVGCTLPIFTAVGVPTYTGVCSRGHETAFQRIESPGLVVPKRSVPLKLRKEWGRDAAAVGKYHEWLEAFRYRAMEEHFLSTHFCTVDCPAYPVIYRFDLTPEEAYECNL